MVLTIRLMKLLGSSIKEYLLHLDWILRLPMVNYDK